jgi:Nuclease-related domain
MSKIELKPPVIIKKLEVLLKRSSPTNHKRPQILESYRRFKAGFTGEQSLKYFYRYLPKDGLLFLPGLRIMHDGYYFQLDQLIVTPAFLLILEIKNLAGHLYLDDKVKQMIRTLDGKRECFEDPIEQVKRQSYHLNQILEQCKFPAIPIERLVVITNPSTIVEFSPTYKEAFVRVIKSAQLQYKFTTFQHKYQTSILTSKEMKKLNKQLFKLHDAHDPDVCGLFQMDKRELLKGVLCPKCDQPFIMYYKGANWWCPNFRINQKQPMLKHLKIMPFLFPPPLRTESTNIFYTFHPQVSRPIC